MTRDEIFQQVSEGGLVAVVRLENENNLEQLVGAMKKGGVTTIEITMTCPDPMGLIKRLSQDKELLIGAGTILNADEAQQAIDVGAEFIVSPILDVDLIKKVKELGKVMVSGAFSPTEIYRAHEAGADAVKVFPAGALGTGYFKDIHGPFPNIELTPTGGVDINNAADFIKNGANFIGAGSALLKKDLVKAEKWDELAEFMAEFVKVIKIAKEGRK